MTDFMDFLYAHYIKPYIDTQPRDDGDQFRQSSYECNYSQRERTEIDAAAAFSITHAFLLGLRTGMGLAEACPTAPVR